MQTAMSVEINRPIEEVFDYTINNVAEWSVIVVKDEVIDKKPEGVGTTFRVTTEERGRRMEFDGIVTRHEPPTVHAVLMKGKQFDIAAEYFFEDLGGRTRVTQRSKVHGKGLVKVVFFLVGWLMTRSSRKAVEQELSNLKRLIETRKSQPA
jgi:polyketide cyclase/dehydrase/lipid transport protein